MDGGVRLFLFQIAMSMKLHIHGYFAERSGNHEWLCIILQCIFKDKM